MVDFTIRAEPDRVVISDSTGATRELKDPILRDRLIEWVAETGGPPDSFDLPSATAIAGLAEAIAMRPRPSNIPAHPETALAGEAVPLAGSVRSSSLDDVLSRRRSVRDVGPLTLSDLASLLVPVGRLNGWDAAPDGYQRTFRPVPSGGGRHPIDLWVAASEVEGLDSGLWAFDATNCRLVHQGPVPSDIWSGASESLEGRRQLPALVLLVAQFERTLSRYPGGAALVWRDAGVLAMALHLQATALSLRSTILGTAGLLGMGPGLRSDIAAVLVGS